MSGGFGTTSLLGGPICQGSTKRGSLGGGQTAPSLSGLSLGAKCGEHLGPHIRLDLYAAEEETLCENLSLTVGCVWAQGPSVGKDSGHLDLSGMTWSEATQKLFHQARMALGFQKHKMAYWAYDFKEVEEIVAERKAAGNSVEAHRVAKRKFAHLKDQWWNKRAKHVERPAKIGDSGYNTSY